MNENQQSVDKLLLELKERAKELNCIYRVEELFSVADITLEEIIRGIVRVIPAGWQYPDVCEARITYAGAIYQTPGFSTAPWELSVNLIVQEEVVGQITVCYTEERPPADVGPFLKEEHKLINTIADRLERRILHETLRTVFESQSQSSRVETDWQVILDLLRRTDPKLLTRISRKMLHLLSWAGVEDADRMLERCGPPSWNDLGGAGEEVNRPSRVNVTQDLQAASQEIFELASRHLGEKEILSKIRAWIKEDRSGFLVKILENPAASLAEIIGAIERFHHLGPEDIELSAPRELTFRVSLIRRILSDDPQFVQMAKRFLDVNNFFELLHRIIYPAGSHGRLGGKSSGLALAWHILQKLGVDVPLLGQFKMPKTWYLTSDGILRFIDYNDLEEIVEHKYESVAQVRQEYPYIVHIFKNSALPPEIMNGLSVALDDVGETPLIVRSSSLLEDRMGTSFAGKYKSLFIANQGPKQQRLSALKDAITEVYASTFGPDPIEYRAERGLVDFHEEMGIMIQEVVGTRIGRYYLPALAGVAFSQNEFRWSRRIRREDGLLRMVPGLGTRAVDRMADDYPILIAPGQPALRVNITLDEKIHYSPKKIDLINLEKNRFETVEIKHLLSEFGDEYPMLNQLVSILRDDRLEQPTGLGIERESDHLVVTFEGLITRTPFIDQVRTALKVLQKEFGRPVDLEFAHDGRDLYLLQCRAQSYGEATQPAVLPREIPQERILFSARRYVSNGVVSGITHIVYVDPQKYAELTHRSDLLAVGRAVGKLNQILPKRQFILMGPGRWGSRGDIRLGVSVSYSDINNSAMLIEIARRQREYVPELSFGTHFFQDLVEASIRYLPLYPDDANILFNEQFLLTTNNTLNSLLPEFAHLSDTIRVIDVPYATGGLVVQILMDAEIDEAVAILTDPSLDLSDPRPERIGTERYSHQNDDHWRWRQQSVEQLAQSLDPDRFGVKALYLIGSTKNATAGPESDIDLLVHVCGSAEQRISLMSWLDGWSICLSHQNYVRTGTKTNGLLDVHIITDEDIQKRRSFAAKIGATTDPARFIPLGKHTSH
ncbi:MAG: pyruvate, phosphate dikinase [Ignavibacteria bacterium]|nr:pyruvate, phosphate dikinase [Ignavibacteria bacterium]